MPDSVELSARKREIVEQRHNAPVVSHTDRRDALWRFDTLGNVMSDLEREARRLGLQALDAALIALGASPLRENSDFRATDPDVGDIPAIVLDKAGAAPFRYILGLDLDIWVGPFSEVVAAPISAAIQTDLQRQIERLLRSVVTCRRGRRSMTIELQLPDEEPWLRLKSTARAWRRRLSRRTHPMSSI